MINKFMTIVLNERKEYLYKICLLGYYSVGKSSIVRQYINNSFDPHEESTIGAAYLTKKVTHKDDLINFEIWDTAGQERYNSLAPMYYRNANCALIVYDITNPDSFEVAKKWVERLREEDKKILLILIGNKCDLENSRNVDEQEIKRYCAKFNLFYCETSAKTRFNIDTIFTRVIEMLPRDKQLKENGVKIGRKKKYACC